MGRSAIKTRVILAFIAAIPILTACRVRVPKSSAEGGLRDMTPQIFSDFDVFAHKNSSRLIEIEFNWVYEGPSHGKLEMNGGGSVLYIPDLNYLGSDRVVFDVMHGGLLEEVVVDIIVIDPENEKMPDDPEIQVVSHSWAIDDIGAPYVWNYGTDCSDIVIAVIDTGIDYNHPDLAGSIWINAAEDINGDGVCDEADIDSIDQDGNGYTDDCRGWDFLNSDNDPMDDHRHGSHVAGIIGATGNNGVGVSGLCWRAKLLPVKILGSDSGGVISDVIEGINYAVINGAKITNNSYLFYANECSDPENWESCINTHFGLFREAISRAHDAGSIFVAGAGNDGQDNDVDLALPATFSLFYDSVISVAASSSGGVFASWSNYGSQSVNIAAPGVSIFSTVSGNICDGIYENCYASMSGTSMATPFVAGSAALLWSFDPDATNMEVIQAILDSAASIPDGSKVTSGGKLDLRAAAENFLGF